MMAKAEGAGARSYLTSIFHRETGVEQAQFAWGEWGWRSGINHCASPLVGYETRKWQKPPAC